MVDALNSRQLWLVLEEDVTVEAIVPQLSTQSYDRLSKSGFDFNALQRKNIGRYGFLNGTDLASWQGKATEQFVANIYDKIKDFRVQHA